MKNSKFNAKKANEIVATITKEHIAAHGTMLFAPTGSLPYVMARQCLDDNSNHALFMTKITKELFATFNNTAGFIKYLNGYDIQRTYKSLGIIVGGCDIKYDGKTGEGTFTLAIGDLDAPIKERETYPFTFDLTTI
jgi:hypothetical protein